MGILQARNDEIFGLLEAMVTTNYNEDNYGLSFLLSALCDHQDACFQLCLLPKGQKDTSQLFHFVYGFMHREFSG